METLDYAVPSTGEDEWSNVPYASAFDDLDQVEAGASDPADPATQKQDEELTVKGGKGPRRFLLGERVVPKKKKCHPAVVCGVILVVLALILGVVIGVFYGLNEIQRSKTPKNPCTDHRSGDDCKIDGAAGVCQFDESASLKCNDVSRYAEACFQHASGSECTVGSNSGVCRMTSSTVLFCDIPNEAERACDDLAVKDSCSVGGEVGTCESMLTSALLQCIVPDPDEIACDNLQVHKSCNRHSGDLGVCEQMDNNRLKCIEEPSEQMDIKVIVAAVALSVVLLAAVLLGIGVCCCRLRKY